MSNEQIFGFDLDEWYLRHAGDDGVLGIDGLCTLVGDSRATGATLIRRDADSAWVRLDTVVPDWARLAPSTQDATETGDPVLHVFTLREWVSQLEALSILLTVHVSLSALSYHQIDVETLALNASSALIGAAVRSGRTRIEMTAREVRMMSGSKRVGVIGLGEIDRTRSRLPEPFSALTGRRVLRSHVGKKLVFNVHFEATTMPSLWGYSGWTRSEPSADRVACLTGVSSARADDCRTLEAHGALLKRDKG